MQSPTETSPERAAERTTHRREVLLGMVEHAAHLLPAQGPITGFVHHNTLHAFEDISFEEAVVEGARTFDCHPYLSEEHYRRELSRGRIHHEDVRAVLLDDLSERGDVLLGFLGTRFHLRQAMLRYSLRIGSADELRWVIAETDVLRRFRRETPSQHRECLINETRHWVMRDMAVGESGRAQASRSQTDRRVREKCERLLDHFDVSNVERWSDATWESLCLHLLWTISFERIRDLDLSDGLVRDAVRHRDALQAATGEDSDERVHEMLIRFCGAFLDQGLGSWTLPTRSAGFYHAFIDLYTAPPSSPAGWLRGLRRELQRIRTAGLEPWECIEESLQQLGVADDEREAFIRQTLLALRGYAGMIWQMETRADRVAQPVPKGSLVEFLAIRLVLDRLALSYLARHSLDYRGPLDGLRDTVRRRSGSQPVTSIEQRSFLVFQLAQLLGWTPETLSRLSAQEWSLMVREIGDFSDIQRRRTYHLAYERRYRIQTLDAVAIHAARSRESWTAEKAGDDGVSQVPAFQVLTCIDEREESFRRHLEEFAPDCETFGVAGFFAIAMYYRGAADAHYTPLCPVIIKPQHYVRESVVYTFEERERRHRQRRRTIGTVTHRVHVGSRTFAGVFLAAVLGSLASIPLVMRILFPRATSQIRRLFGSLVRPPLVTHLQLERKQETPGPEEGHIGYTIAEMAVIVERLLRDMGLTTRLSRLIVVCGHGSSSLNNPHESAHDCGACGGGRGGPNSRAFAQMANDLQVRSLLEANGLRIPQDTVFVGAYHNTCDDSVSYYDLDRLPETHRRDFEKASLALDVARERSAHERCRRFESAPLGLTTEAALRHVEGRAEDLSQVRPEYGHASNALCFVGRRQWSRGLYLDRRAFLQSYDPDQDDAEYTILTRILQAVVPVCAGINLEYYFSFVDPTGYGCGTKLPHNIASLLGVMNGAASDLRPGLPWQMVEIHEPVRLLFVIETTPQALLKIMERNPGIARLCHGNWVQVAAFDARTCDIQIFRGGTFERYEPESTELPTVSSSIDWYRGWRGHLGFASVES